MKDKIIIRKANLGDVKGCAKLSRIPELQLAGRYYPPQTWFKSIIKSDQILIVAESKKKIVGLRMGEKLAGPVGIAHLFVIKKEYRGKGIGKLLAEKFEKECRKKKIRWLLTYVYAKNLDTIKFFEKYGYKKGSLVYECYKDLK